MRPASAVLTAHSNFALLFSRKIILRQEMGLSQALGLHCAVPDIQMTLRTEATKMINMKLVATKQHEIR